MPLRSKLFRGDMKCEACLNQDPAHITPGSRGDHVSKIHTALFAIDAYSVDARELRDGLYGPSTARSVLAYKQKRNIINRAYQTKADDIVGKMTIASLDAEMVRVESQVAPTVDANHLGWTTRRV
jgi:peptidoglycan hydrolase-like protein with peptidoglycan-binding domain